MSLRFITLFNLPNISELDIRENLITVEEPRYNYEENSGSGVCGAPSILETNNPNIYYNIACILSDNRKTKLSIKYFNKSLSLRPKDVSCNWNLALCLLRSQNFEEGFELYEYRWLTKRVEKKFTNIKSLFESKEPKNKNILIWSEQGFGDNINFSRFVIDLKNKNNNKIFFAAIEGL